MPMSGVRLISSCSSSGDPNFSSVLLVRFLAPVPEVIKRLICNQFGEKAQKVRPLADLYVKRNLRFSGQESVLREYAAGILW